MRAELRARSTCAAALSIAVALAAPSRSAAVEGGAGPDPAVSTTAGAGPAWWSAGAQATYVLQRKLRMHAEYSGEHSLVPEPETGYTLTATLYLGARPWRGGELWLHPESIQSVELSSLHGLGGLTNGENQKSGGPLPQPYFARAFYRQTIELGGAPVELPPGASAFAPRTTSRRLVITAGKLALIDVFDNNAWSHDPRTQFMNWSLMTFGASDYAADARGYTWGLAVEASVDAWALRAGRFAQPRRSNGLFIDPDLLRSYGDNLELEHAHALGGLAGKVRVAGWRNVARMGGFRDALAAAGPGGVPSVAAVRRPRAKLGYGVAFEQALPADLGLFGRWSWNDGATETYAFTEIERSLSLGLGARGTAWRRPGDSAGVAFAVNGLSAAHRAYLAAGGLGAFIGDGRLAYAPEEIVEAYYSWKVRDGFWVSGDVQWAVHPAYNADRGPATFLGGRVHLEL